MHAKYSLVEWYANGETETNERNLMKTWFITGTSAGFGRHWTEAALERGDQVVATARSLDAISDYAERFGASVLPLHLDVTDREGVFVAVEHALARFGRIDVVVNNAGYGHFGMVEELSEREIRDQFETNFFGALWVTQAVLPILRTQRSGHVIQVTSQGGVRAFPGLGAYHASKWALEGLTESLWQELDGHGIRFTNLQPGPYLTDWYARGSRHSAPLEAYDTVRAAAQDWDPGDPVATRAAILELVDAPNPPNRLFFGKSFPEVEEIYRDRLDTWRAWQDLSVRAFGDPASALAAPTS